MIIQVFPTRHFPTRYFPTRQFPTKTLSQRLFPTQHFPIRQITTTTLPHPTLFHPILSNFLFVFFLIRNTKCISNCQIYKNRNTIHMVMAPERLHQAFLQRRQRSFKILAKGRFSKIHRGVLFFKRVRVNGLGIKRSICCLDYVCIGYL